MVGVRYDRPGTLVSKKPGIISWDDAGSSTEEGDVIPTKLQGVHTVIWIMISEKSTLVDSSFVFAWKS